LILIKISSGGSGTKNAIFVDGGILVIDKYLRKTKSFGNGMYRV
jgi:hypothetical protein